MTDYRDLVSSEEGDRVWVHPSAHAALTRSRGYR